MKKAVIISVSSFLAMIVMAAALIFGIRYYSGIPFSDSAETVTMEIPQGAGLQKISKLLEDSGLTRSAILFRAYAIIERRSKKIRAGEYELRKNMTDREILVILSEGMVKLHKIVIPEGYTVSQIAKAVEDSSITTAAAFLETASDRVYIRELGIKAESIEGYLYPDTYLFPKKTDPKKIIKAMTSGLFKIITPEIVQRSAMMNMTLHQTLTLASIIEKETGNASERPLISSVFHNRMKMGMRLETDPAVIYGIKNFDGNLTKNDLRTPGPYNTYMIQGLPPGPIANPGEAAIKAALYPADTRYLYFVSKKDSTHFFSTNYRDHQNAVRYYQMRR